MIRELDQLYDLFCGCLIKQNGQDCLEMWRKWLDYTEGSTGEAEFMEPTKLKW